MPTRLASSDLASSESTQHAEYTSSDASTPSTRGTQNDRAASAQHVATHRDPAILCTTIASADDSVRSPSDTGVLRMFDLMKACCEDAPQPGANLEERVVARNILRTSPTGTPRARWWS